MAFSLGQKMNIFKAPTPVERPIPFSANANSQSLEAKGIPENAFASMAQKYNTQPLPSVSFVGASEKMGIPANAFASMAQKYNAQPLDPPKMTGNGTSFMPAGALGENAIAYNCLGKKGVMGGSLNFLS